MDPNLFHNYTNDSFDNEDAEMYGYIASENFIENGNRRMMPSNSNRYQNQKNLKRYTSKPNYDENLAKIIPNIYKKKFLHNNYINNNMVLNDNKINNNRKNKMVFSNSINKNEESYDMIMNNKNENLQKKYIRMSYNPHSMDENVEFYSEYKSINKNIQKQLRNKGYNRNNNNNINSNKDRNIEIRIDLDNFNSNSKSKEIYLDKKDFMKNIKEINDLDYIDNVPEEDNNKLILKYNNIYNENKNIYLNKKNYKNQKSINNTSEKKEIKNYNRIINRNNNLVIPQKETKTDKKKENIRYSKNITQKELYNNFTENKNNNSLKKDLISFGNLNGEKMPTLINDGNKFINLPNNNNKFKNKTKILENELEIIKLRNSNNTKYQKKFSDQLNISPTIKRFSTLTNDKEEENNIIESEKDNDIYKQLNNAKNINKNLLNKIDNLNKEIQKKNIIIKKLYSQNQKYKSIVQKMKIDSDSKMKVNKDLLNQLNICKKEIVLLKNKAKYNNDNNNLLKHKYLREINRSKEKLIQYENENNNLKVLLMRNKEKQYSTDISKNNIYNSFINLDDQSREISNYREFNKSMNISRPKNRLNIPIFKKYQEDKEITEIKSSDENGIPSIKFKK